MVVTLAKVATPELGQLEFGAFMSLYIPMSVGMVLNEKVWSDETCIVAIKPMVVTT